MSFFAVDNLGIRFGGVVAVDGVSFEVKEGECFTIIGPNEAEFRSEGGAPIRVFRCTN